MYQDTSPARLRQYVEHLRGLSTIERGRILSALCAGVRQAAEVGIRQRFPGIGDEELRVRLAVRLYGRQVASRVFKNLPDDAV